MNYQKIDQDPPQGHLDLSACPCLDLYEPDQNRLCKEHYLHFPNCRTVERVNVAAIFKIFYYIQHIIHKPIPLSHLSTHFIFIYEYHIHKEAKYDMSFGTIFYKKGYGLCKS